jgi:radical SAM superfamily enzyme YgiQ (UPF0313 family)
MNILLVEQLKRSQKSKNQFLTRFLTSFSILPTLYIRQLAAITPKKHDVTIINERYDALKISNHYDLVVIHFTTGSAKIAYNIADQFREKKISVILCGLHASALPDEALTHADSVLLGRGECNWLTLLEDFEKNQLKKIYSPEPFDNDTCKIPPTKVDLPGFVIMGAVEATRGCPYQCNFCPEGNTSYANHFYTRPIDQVISEIKEIPQKIIMFYDLSLTVNSEYAKELFLKMRPLNKHFFCNGNIDVLSKDSDLVHLSKLAGCIGWLVGFESFDQTTLDSVGKSTNKVEEYKKVVELIHSHKMIVIGDFMFGFDHDTPEVFDKTLTMLEKLQIDVADFTILTPFPGTPLFDQLQKENRILTTEWDEYTMFKPVFQPKQMTPEQLQQGVFKLYSKYYAPKQTIFRVLRICLKGFYPFVAALARNLLASFNSMFFTK